MRAAPRAVRHRQSATCSAPSCWPWTTSCRQSRSRPCWWTWPAAMADQDTSMKVVRTAAQRGFILPERGYPLPQPAARACGAPEPALTLRHHPARRAASIPMARSGGRRARHDAGSCPPPPVHAAPRRLGMGYRRLSMLYQPDCIMQLGQAYLGQADQQLLRLLPDGASPPTTPAPAGPRSGSAFCGDPRGAAPPIRSTSSSASRSRDPQLRDAGDGGHAGLSRARLARRLGPDHPYTADLKRGGYGTYAGPLRATPARPLPVGGIACA